MNARETDKNVSQCEVSAARYVQCNIIEGEERRSDFSDPSFYKNKDQPIHRWAPWIAGFSRTFVKESIERYIPDGGTVLDPFSGVGTTLVESILSGCDCIGFEINPYAHFVCETKIAGIGTDLDLFDKEVQRFGKFYRDCLGSSYIPKSGIPEGFRSRVDFYSPNVLHKVLILQDFISQIERKEILSLFRLAFSSTMVRYSNYSYEPSLGTRRGSGKEDIMDFDVGGTILKKLEEFRKDMIWANKEMKMDRIPASEVICGSFFDYSSYLDKESVDIIITSPPYLNNYHYNRNTRPQLYWLGFVSTAAEMKELEEANFGTYWQNARDKDNIDLAFDLPGSDLHERLEEIRGLNQEKGVYGGNGWANYAASYFNDCYKLSQGIDHSLKSDSTALVVIGNSIIQGVPIPTDVYFAQIAESLGLEIVKIHVPRETRVGNSISGTGSRSKPKSKQNLYEAIIELKKI